MFLKVIMELRKENQKLDMRVRINLIILLRKFSEF